MRCNQAKVFFKRGNLKDDLFNLEKRLLGDYNCLEHFRGLKQGDILFSATGEGLFNGAGAPALHEGMSEDEYDSLMHTLRNLSVVAKLLR